MIAVEFTPIASQIMQAIGLSEAEVLHTVNNRTRGWIDPSGRRIICVNWGETGRVVFFDGQIVDVEQNGDQVRVKRVQVCAPALLTDQLPGGRLMHAMNARETLELVAKSFGASLRCHPEAPFSKLFAGTGKIEWLEFEHPVGDSECLVIANTVNAETLEMICWAFDWKRYVAWWTTGHGLN